MELEDTARDGTSCGHTRGEGHLCSLSAAQVAARVGGQEGHGGDGSSPALGPDLPGVLPEAWRAAVPGAGPAGAPCWPSPPESSSGHRAAGREPLWRRATWPALWAVHGRRHLPSPWSCPGPSASLVQGLWPTRQERLGLADAVQSQVQAPSPGAEHVRSLGSIFVGCAGASELASTLAAGTKASLLRRHSAPCFRTATLVTGEGPNCSPDVLGSMGHRKVQLRREPAGWASSAERTS